MTGICTRDSPKRSQSPTLEEPYTFAVIAICSHCNHVIMSVLQTFFVTYIVIEVHSVQLKFFSSHEDTKLVLLHWREHWICQGASSSLTCHMNTRCTTSYLSLVLDLTMFYTCDREHSSLAHILCHTWANNICRSSSKPWNGGYVWQHRVV